MSRSYRQTSAPDPRERRSTVTERTNVRFGTMRFSVHIPPRITAVTSVRDSRHNILGWKFKCYSCNTENVFMTHQRPEADQRTRDHRCRKTQND